MEFDPRTFDMSPLPRDREVAWCGDSHRLAREQTEHRRDMAEKAARAMIPRIRDSIMEAIQSHDTVNGYAPEEVAMMRRVADGP